MAESLAELVDGPLTTLQALTIVAIVYQKGKSPDPSPSEFFGMSGSVQDAVDNGKAAIQHMLKKQCRLDWDGVVPLFQFLIAECRDQCVCDRAYAELAVDENKIEWAIKVLQNHRENGGLPALTVAKARDILKVAYSKAVGDEVATIVVEPEKVMENVQ